MSDLPRDLVEEILCRVPATSIKRLRYTCKGWNSLLNKRRFIRKHMDKAAKQLLVLKSKQNRVCLMSVNFYGIQSAEVKAEYTLVDPQAKFKICQVSHCDGLLLCNNDAYDRIVVWNPCTGQTKWIQPREIGFYAFGSYKDNIYMAILATKSCLLVIATRKNSKSMRLTLICGGLLMSLWTASWNMITWACLWTFES